jgi:hypothetical protein
MGNRYFWINGAKRMGQSDTPPDLRQFFDTIARPHSIDKERDAYRKLRLSIDNEQDPEIRIFMEETLEYHCQEAPMLLSFVLESLWEEWIQKQRASQLLIQPIQLFIALESILANDTDSSAYTKNPGPRYPLTVPGHHSSETKTKNVDRNIPAARLLRSYYKFGAHKLYVGRAIRDILDYLQTRYKIDFNELEHQRQNRPEV